MSWNACFAYHLIMGVIMGVILWHTSGTVFSSPSSAGPAALATKKLPNYIDQKLTFPSKPPYSARVYGVTSCNMELLLKGATITFRWWPKTQPFHSWRNALRTVTKNITMFWMIQSVRCLPSRMPSARNKTALSKATAHWRWWNEADLMRCISCWSDCARSISELR